MSTQLAGSSLELKFTERYPDLLDKIIRQYEEKWADQLAVLLTITILDQAGLSDPSVFATPEERIRKLQAASGEARRLRDLITALRRYQEQQPVPSPALIREMERLIPR